VNGENSPPPGLLPQGEEVWIVLPISVSEVVCPLSPPLWWGRIEERGIFLANLPNYINS